MDLPWTTLVIIVVASVVGFLILLLLVYYFAKRWYTPFPEYKPLLQEDGDTPQREHKRDTKLGRRISSEFSPTPTPWQPSSAPHEVLRPSIIVSSPPDKVTSINKTKHSSSSSSSSGDSYSPLQWREMPSVMIPKESNSGPIAFIPHPSLTPLLSPTNSVPNESYLERRTFSPPEGFLERKAFSCSSISSSSSSSSSSEQEAREHQEKEERRKKEEQEKRERIEKERIALIEEEEQKRKEKEELERREKEEKERIALIENERKERERREQEELAHKMRLEKEEQERKEKEELERREKEEKARIALIENERKERERREQEELEREMRLEKEEQERKEELEHEKKLPVAESSDSEPQKAQKSHSSGEGSSHSTQSSHSSSSSDSSSTQSGGNSRSSSNSSSGSSSGDDSSSESLVNDYYGFSEPNFAGLRRAKKSSYVVPHTKSEPLYQNEDMIVTANHLEDDKDISLFCVFDGHAGKECAEELKTVYPDSFYNTFLRKNGYSKKDLTDVWIQSYKESESTLQETGAYDFMGATATTAAVWTFNSRKRYLQVANLGDSTAYFQGKFRLDEEPEELAGKCRILRLSEDHNPTELAERERIKEMGIELGEFQTRLEGGLAVSRAFGDFLCKVNPTGLVATPYISPAIPLEDNYSFQRLIVASDGLWDVFSGEEAFEMIRGTRSAKEATRVLIKATVDSKKCDDNVSVIVVFL